MCIIKQYCFDNSTERKATTEKKEIQILDQSGFYGSPPNYFLDAGLLEVRGTGQGLSAKPRAPKFFTQTK